MACLAWLLAYPAANMELTLLSGSWPPRPPQSPSPHAVLLVVPGMSSTVGVARNVVRNVEHMAPQARLDPRPHSAEPRPITPIKPTLTLTLALKSTLSLNCLTLTLHTPTITLSPSL